MAGINATRQLIYDTFINGWAGATAIDAENEEFIEPESDPWVRLTVRHVPGEPETMGKKGNRKFRRKGILFIQVFTPINTGTFTSDQLAEAARTLLEGERLSKQCWTGVSAIREVGAKGKWYAANVETEFTYEEIK